MKLADNTLDKQAAVLTDLTAPQLSLEIRLKNLGVLERLSTFYISTLSVLAESKIDTLQDTVEILRDEGRVMY